VNRIDVAQHLPTVGDGSPFGAARQFHKEELQLAFRNRGMPLEALRYPVTPTGLHYLLIHFDIPYVDANTWQLTVGGVVSKPMTLTLDDIRQRPAVTLPVTMECAGNGRALLEPRPISQPWMLEAIGTAEWTGTPLRGILEDAGIDSSAVEVLFTGLDRGIQGGEVQEYQRSLHRDEALRDEVLLAYAMNGAPLEPQHGFPLRLIVSGWYGMTSVKWLDRIEAIGTPFHGYQQDATYRSSQSKEDPGRPVTLMKVRALMIPPGIVDFLTRSRVLEAGMVTLRGRAWAGRTDVARVDIGSDSGTTWSPASIGTRMGAHAWYEWTFDWRAVPGRQTLCVRATDAAGNVQPVDQPWNYQGMENNMVQRVDVLVV